MTLRAKLFAAASAYPPLQGLLTSGSVFQWYAIQLPQTAELETAGAITVTVVSNPQSYAFTGRLPTSFTRVQFTIYGNGNDGTNADAIANALFSFLDQWSGGSGIPNLTQYSNLVVGDRDFGIAQTQPLTYMRVIDAQIMDNSQV